VARIVAIALVAIGVAIEFGSEWISRPFEETVTHAREVQVLALEADAKRLSAEAETAEREIAIARADAAKADENAGKANERAAVASGSTLTLVSRGAPCR
jgi:hypothetical protein